MGLFGFHPVTITGDVCLYVNQHNSDWVRRVQEVTSVIEEIELANIRGDARLELRLVDEMQGRYEINPVNCTVVGVMPRDIGGYVPAKDGYKAYDLEHSIPCQSGYEFTGNKFTITRRGDGLPVTIDVYVHSVVEGIFA